MSDPSTLSSALSTQAIKVIESDPLSPAAWEQLAEKARGQNDPLSIKSLEIIVEGLKKFAEIKATAEEKKLPPPQISGMSKTIFLRLAKAYNSPTLLKEAGLIYLRDLGLPNVALQHFERSMRLGGPEKELRPLSEAAAVAVQRQISLQSGQEAGHSGITTAQHAKPVAPNIIRKTGKLLMPTRINQTSVTKLTAELAGLEKQEAEPLPSTTPECLKGAEAAIEKKQLVRAEALLKKANENPASNPDMWQAWTNLGQACYEAGLPVRVETAFAEAIKYDPDELASHYNLALGYHLNDKYELALAEYLKADAIEQKHPKVWCNVGVLYFQMDEYAKAELALRVATTVAPDYARAWDNLGATLGAEDKFDEALAACQKAIELRPDYPEAYFKRGVIYFSRNEFAEASAEFKRAAQLPAVTAYCEAFQSMIHSQLDQPEDAEAAVQRAVKADPKCELLWMAWNDLGLAWHAAGNYPKAATAYEEATMIKPDEPEAWFNLGVSYHQSGDLKAARDSYQHAVDLRESLAAAWHNLGIICTETNDHEAAMTAFRREVNLDPDNVRAWYDYALTLDKLGRKDEAGVAFAKVDLLSNAQIEAPEY